MIACRELHEASEALVPDVALPLPFVYLSNGKEIAFKDCRKPNAKYEIITKFPRPWDLVRRLHLGEFDGLPYLSPKDFASVNTKHLTIWKRPSKTASAAQSWF